MESLLTNPFPPADKAAWRAQVQKDLKDPVALDSLNWHPETSDRKTSDREPPDQTKGITLEPYYTSGDMLALPLAQNQSAQPCNPGWLNAPAYELTGDVKADNLRLRDALSRGADALVLTVPTDSDLPKLLDGLKLSDTPVYFRLQGDADTFLERLRQVAPYQLRGGVLTDTDTTIAVNLLSQTADSPNFCTICIGSHPYHNAGATATQELAFMLGALADRYDALTHAGLSVDQLIPKTILSVAIGTSYFMEIAKLRALRVLWSRFVSAYQTTPPARPAFIHAQTSSFYEAVRSSYTNLLRATTEAMAAVIGGCDVLTVRPYNAVFTQSVDGSDQAYAGRIARNVSILLKEESYLDKVADPAAGSYYIETLTNTLAEAAWALFLRVEAARGLAKSADLVQSELDAAYQAKVDALKNGRVMVGVNKFQEGEVKRSPQPVTVENAGPGLPVRRLASFFE